jgi:hypothetical protein
MVLKSNLDLIDEFTAYLNYRDDQDGKLWHRLCDEEDRQGLSHGTLSGETWGRLTAYRRMRRKLREMKTRINKQGANG